MSYETRIDEMVGQHVKVFQDEVTLAKTMESHARAGSAMPYGYPIAVYCPRHICRIPRKTKYVARDRDKLSNGVPKVLAMEIVNQYLLGLYNPMHARPARERVTDRPRRDGVFSGLVAWLRSLPSSLVFAAN